MNAADMTPIIDTLTAIKALAHRALVLDEDEATTLLAVRALAVEALAQLGDDDAGDD